jgi:hypothetical protein
MVVSVSSQPAIASGYGATLIPNRCFVAAADALNPEKHTLSVPKPAIRDRKMAVWDRLESYFDLDRRIRRNTPRSQGEHGEDANRWTDGASCKQNSVDSLSPWCDPPLG